MMKLYGIVAILLLSVNAIKAIDDNTFQRELIDSVKDNEATPGDFWFLMMKPKKPPVKPSMGKGMSSKMGKPTPKMGMPKPSPKMKPKMDSMKMKMVAPKSGKGKLRP
jgi:hypothetical protein